MSFLDKLPRPFLVLAPMDDVTDTVFRQIVADCAPPDLYFTEFVNVDGLQSPGRQKLIKKLQFTSKEKPIFAQLWGLKPDNFYKTVKEIVDGTLVDEINNSRRSSSSKVQGSKGAKRARRTPATASELRTQLTPQFAESSSGASGSARRQAVAAGSSGGFDGVDINMGCPVKTVIKNGACAALINNRELAGEIIEAAREAASSTSPRGTHLDAAQGAGEDRKGDVLSGTLTANRNPQRSDAPEAAGRVGGSADEQARAVRVPRDFPVSVKTRVGFSTTDIGWLEFLLQKKLDLLSIHGRTAKQMSKVPADWDLIGEIREMRDALCPATKIVGNGDVMGRGEALKLAKEHKLDGIMIGRGIFHDPFVFAKKSPWERMGKEQKIELFRKHIDLFAKTWKDGEYKFETLKKFAKVYINDFDGASELRVKFMESENTNQALGLLIEHFQALK